jgi:ABC-type transporter Mla subunit MlaD
MSSYTRLEISVGVFVIMGAAAIAYLSLTLGGLTLGADRRYSLRARFASVGDLKVGDPVSAPAAEAKQSPFSDPLE